MTSVGDHCFEVLLLSCGQVCTRSLPRMEAVPVIHCPTHSTCMPSADGENSCITKACVAGSETACGLSSVSMGGSSDSTVGDSSLGESLLDPPQCFRSPPRAAEAPDLRFGLFRRVGSEGKSHAWRTQLNLIRF